MTDNVFNISKNFVRLGSFWYGQMSPKGRRHAKAMSAMTLFTNGITQISNAINNIRNLGDELYATNLGQKVGKYYRASSTAITETDLVLQAPDCEGEVPPAYSGNWFVVPYNNFLEVYRIRTDEAETSRSLINGVDFRQTANYLWFEEDPADLFVNGVMYLNGRWITGALAGQSVYAGVTNTPNIPVGYRAQYITNYLNGGNQSPEDFKLMLNSAMNAVVLQKTCRLKKYIRPEAGTTSVYIFEDVTPKKEQFVVHVPYQGIETNIPSDDFDTVYPKGFVIDTPIEVLYNMDGSLDWFLNAFSSTDDTDGIKWKDISAYPDIHTELSDELKGTVFYNGLAKFDGSTQWSTPSSGELQAIPYFALIQSNNQTAVDAAGADYVKQISGRGTPSTDAVARQTEYVFRYMVPNAIICVIDIQAVTQIKSYQMTEDNVYPELRLKLTNIYNNIKNHCPVGYLPIVRVKYKNDAGQAVFEAYDTYVKKIEEQL